MLTQSDSIDIEDFSYPSSESIPVSHTPPGTIPQGKVQQNIQTDITLCDNITP